MNQLLYAVVKSGCDFTNFILRTQNRDSLMINKSNYRKMLISAVCEYTNSVAKMFSRLNQYLF